MVSLPYPWRRPHHHYLVLNGAPHAQLRPEDHIETQRLSSLLSFFLMLACRSHVDFALHSCGAHHITSKADPHSRYILDLVPS